MTTRDKESIAQLLKETIIQLCKANVRYSGQVEIDGIICITGQVEGQELVIKVHEIFATPQDLRTPYVGVRYPAVGSRFSGFQNLLGDYRRHDPKRRRLDGDYGFLRPSSFAYSYLSNLVYDQSHPSAFTEPRPDQRNDATDLSIKSATASAEPANRLSDARGENSASPPDADLKFNVGETSSLTSRTPIRSLLGQKVAMVTDRWSPPDRALPAVPECRLCSYKFESSEALSEHNEAVHSVFTCLCCFKTFTSRSNLERHSRLHTGHKPYSCTICGKAFSRKDHLSNHATKHAFKCSTCSQRCADRNALVSHFLYEHSAILTRVCDFCNKGFSGTELYEEHLKSHPQFHISDSKSSGTDQVAAGSSSLRSAERYTCKSCDFESMDRVTLVKHELVHSDGQKFYTCLSCGKVFEDPLLYGDHMLLHQSETDIFECCICRQICSTLASLRRHEAAHIYEALEPEPMAEEEEDRYDGRCEKMMDTSRNLQERLEMHELEKEQHSHDFRNGSRYIGRQNLDMADDANCVEDCSVATDPASRRDKRKQKQPKLVVNVNEIGGGGESDVDVVEPKSPVDPMQSSAVPDEYKNCQFVITENPGCIIKVAATGKDAEIKMEPVRSIMNRPSANSLSALVKMKDHSRADGLDLSSLLLKVDEPSVKQERPEECGSTPMNLLMDSMESSIPATSRYSSGRRRRTRVRHKANSDRSGRCLSAACDGHGLLSDGMNGSDVLLNNNTIGTRNENRPLSSIDLPPGPFACAVCSYEASTFLELDGHCATTHSRSPCMFCSKTFAQKANRDRHHCLHTGDKPYGCPECSEKFSRGDKLKMHRVRAHGVQYPLYSSRHKDGSSHDRDFSVSPLSFLGTQPDGPGQTFCFGELPSSRRTDSPESEEVRVDSRPCSALADSAPDGFIQAEDDPGRLHKISLMPENSDSTISALMNKWIVEKRPKMCWMSAEMENGKNDNGEEVVDCVTSK